MRIVDIEHLKPQWQIAIVHWIPKIAQSSIKYGSTRAFRAAVGIQINIHSDISFVF